MNTLPLFKDNGCLRIPYVLPLFADTSEPSPEVVEHLLTCDLCRDCLNPTVKKTGYGRSELTEHEIPPELFQKAELLFYDILFDKEYASEKLKEAYKLLKNSGTSTWKHMAEYLNQLSVFCDNAERVIKAQTLLFTDAFSLNMRTRFTANDDENDTAEFSTTLNNIVCRVIYRGGGQDTLVLLEVPDTDTTVLSVYPLPDESCYNIEDSDKIELKRSSYDGKKKVAEYKLDGNKCWVIMFPGVFGAIKIFRMDLIKNRK